MILAQLVEPAGGAHAAESGKGFPRFGEKVCLGAALWPHGMPGSHSTFFDVKRLMKSGMAPHSEDRRGGSARKLLTETGARPSFDPNSPDPLHNRARGRQKTCTSHPHPGDCCGLPPPARPPAELAKTAGS